MKTIFVHVGSHKTGTTALQTFFSLNSALLRKKGGVHYLNTGRGGASPECHHILALALRDQLPPDAVPFLQEIESSDCSKFLISSEIFMEYHAAPKLREAFRDYDVQLVLYVRRQDLRTQSEYNFAVKSAKCRFSGIIHDYYLCKQRLDFLNYHHHLEQYRAVFGHDHIWVRVHQPHPSENSIYLEFLEILGIPWSDEFIVACDQRANRSLTLPCLEFKRLLNKTPLSYEEDSRLSEELSKLSIQIEQECRKNQNLLSPPERFELVRQYQESNRRVAKEYLGLDELFREPWPDLKEDWEPFVGIKLQDLQQMISGLLRSGSYTEFEMTDLLARMACVDSTSAWKRPA